MVWVMPRAKPLDHIDVPSDNPPVETDSGDNPSLSHAVLCPYCGSVAVEGKCQSCGGLLEPLSKQATQNDMGPWFIRDEDRPFQPGCSYATLRKLALKGRLSQKTIIRGPSSRQFWSFARNVRGVAHLLGECHNCHGPAGPDEYMCRSCGAVFEATTDRQSFGIGPIRLIPGQTPPDIVAQSIVDRENKAKTDNQRRSRHRSGAVPIGSTPRPEPALAQALQRVRHQLRSSRRIVIISVAANVVLAMTILVMSLAPKFTVGANHTTVPVPAVEPDADANAGPPVVSPLVLNDADAQQFDAARNLAATDDPADLQQAEQLLEALVSKIPADQRPAEVDDLLGRVQRRLDEQSLSNFLPPDQSAPPD